ncbi:MAG: Eco57I restriction-modification methylase domain-containing protein [Elusimicrobiota bacterium]
MVIHEEREPFGLKDEIKILLDDQLEKEKLQRKGDLREGSIKLFQQLFVEKLNFDIFTGSFMGIAEEISTDDWSKSSQSKRAFIIAEAFEFRVIYIELAKLTRTAERHAVSSMRAQGWARKKEFIAIFHSEESDVWHLVSPHVEEGEGRTVLRRYVIGEGETHRTVSENLAEMDASLPEPLYEKVQTAFKLQPVTEKFYKDYKENFNRLDTHFREKGMDIKHSKKYSHLILNRLMFLYFLQKKKWLNKDKNFMSWFLKEYEHSEDNNCFHKKWMNTLFFKAMNDKNIDEDFPDDVKIVLENFPFLNGGLFSKVDFEREEYQDDEIYLTDHLAKYIIRGFLENYNFTVTEESPFDVDVAVDPAMLGKIYESLIAEEERGKSGIFYTPRVEVDLMCKMALYEYLVTKANDLDEKGKRKIIEFIFTPLEKWEYEEEGDVSKLMDILHNAKVVDPACGSGAFLVGMMQVFSNLYRKLGKEPDYKFRERIVNENLYGVDIKDWAVRMAEFRLWLALVESEKELPHVEPILPNFSFKLKVGDSIVQKVGDEHLNLKKLVREATGSMINQIDELKKLKRKYFEGKSNLKEKILEKQNTLIIDYLESKIKKLESKKNKSQVSLSGNVTKEALKDNKELKEKINKIENIIKKIDETDRNDLFWDLDFPEVMLEGGFDVVVGNPPYVPHQKIVPQDIPPEIINDMTKKEFDNIKNKYKDDLISYCQNLWDYKPYRTSDLYLYFYFKSLELLKTNGILVFITSNAWLDVSYGKRLQELLLKETKILRIFENRLEKVFKKQDVNIIISVFKKVSRPEEDSLVNFTSIKEKNTTNLSWIEDILMNNFSYKDIKYMGENLRFAKEYNVRNVQVYQSVLWLLGGGKLNKTSNGVSLTSKYKGNMWGGLFIRAPDIFYKILQKNENDIFWIDKDNVETYLNTGGADDFFFVNAEEKDKEYFNIKTENGETFNVEKEYIDDFVESPTQLSNLKIRENEAISYILKIPRGSSKKELSKKKVWDYIKWGENQGFNNVSGRKNKKRWEILPKQAYETSEIHIACYMSHPRIYYNPKKLITHRFFRYYPDEEIDSKSMALTLNSCITLLTYELFRNPSLGGGVLAVGKDSIGKFIYADPNCIDSTDELYDEFLSREQKPILDELGFDKDIPIEEQEPSPKKDRKKLDEEISKELGLSKEDIKSIYTCLAKLTQERLKKGSS